MWCTVWGKTYSCKKDKEERFCIFEKAIVDRPTTQYEVRYNYPHFADQTEQELNDSFCNFNRFWQPFNALIYKSEIKWWPKLAKSYRNCWTKRHCKFHHYSSDSDCYSSSSLSEYLSSSDSVEDEEALAKLKDSVSKVASLTNREIFYMWRTVWRKTYSKGNEDDRFRIFEKAIVDVAHSMYNYPSLADRTIEELVEIFRPFNRRGLSWLKKDLASVTSTLPILVLHPPSMIQIYSPPSLHVKTYTGCS